MRKLAILILTMLTSFILLGQRNGVAHFKRVVITDLETRESVYPVGGAKIIFHDTPSKTYMELIVPGRSPAKYAFKFETATKEKGMVLIEVINMSSGINGYYLHKLDNNSMGVEDNGILITLSGIINYTPVVYQEPRNYSDEEIRQLREEQSFKSDGGYIHTPNRYVPSREELIEKAVEETLNNR